MFPARYFTRRYFPGRYFPAHAAAVALRPARLLAVIDAAPRKIALPTAVRLIGVLR